MHGPIRGIMADIHNRADLLKAIHNIQEQFNSRWKQKRIEESLAELNDIEMNMTREDFWDNPDAARETSMRKSALEKMLQPWQDLKAELIDFPELVELTFEEYENEKEALDTLLKDYERIEEQFEKILLADALSGDDDHRNAILNISCGAGGTESQDWAEMLLRMYRRYFEEKGYKVEIVDLQDGEEAGIKGATLFVKGENAFGYLKSENGVHRLVRISPFDSNKRRHTSFASVHITPEIDEDIEIDIDEKDLRVDTYRASGAGGQHVNKTDSAIRITHIPSNIVVQCQSERSQMKNRATAMKMLKARLYEEEKLRREEDLESRSGEKKDVAWGSQIRSYVFHPYRMVKDLRTDYETGDVDAVMNGKIEPFIDAYLKSLIGGEKQ